MSILIGCDPELFLKKDGLFRSAYGLIKGDKKNPFPVDKGAVQVDGMALELNIHPASSAEEFSQNIETVLTQMKAMVPEYEVVATPTAEFELEYFASQPHDALALGCEPDFNAYSFEENPRPRTDKPIRTGGGHIHIGWGEGLDTSKGSDHFFHCASLTRVLDTYVGSLSLLWDADDERRAGDQFLHHPLHHFIACDLGQHDMKLPRQPDCALPVASAPGVSFHLQVL